MPVQPKYPGDLGQIIDLVGGAAIPVGMGTDVIGGFEVGRPSRLIFVCHVEFDGATNLTGVQFRLQGSYEPPLANHWANILMQDASTDTKQATWQVLKATGANQTVLLYADNLKGVRYGQLLVVGLGVAGALAGDLVTVNAEGW